MQQNTAPALSTACTAQAAQYLGGLSPFKGTGASADVSALATVIFTENPHSPNRIGRQRGYLKAGG